MGIIHDIVLYIHILSVIMSIGPFFIMFPIINKVKGAKGVELEAYLIPFKASVRLAKHSGHALAVSGVLLIFLSGWTWKTSWIDVTIITMVSSLFFLARAFSPTLKRFEQSNQNSEELVKRLFRSTAVYLLLLMLMLWLMVSKPSFW